MSRGVIFIAMGAAFRGSQLSLISKSAFLDPLMIAPARGRQSRSCPRVGTTEEDRLQGEGIDPFLYLGVAVGKAKSASAIVVGSGQVVPGILIQEHHKQAGDNAVRMPVHTNPSAGWKRELG